jgi:hypothetical protein
MEVLMKMRTIGVMTAGILSLTAFIGTAAAQCPPTNPPSSVMIEFDANSFAYEPNYNSATFQSTAGNQLTMVGIIDKFYAPLAFLNPADPTKEYTFVVSGLTSLGTVPTVAGPTTFYKTDYSGGSFTIYEDSPEDAPLAAAMGANPFGGATVPANFQNGTAILTGNLCGFTFTVTKTVIGPNTTYGGSFTSTYNFTGGTQYGLVGGAQAVFGGVWCARPATGCVPANYIGHPNGKWDSPPTTATTRSTWGTLKQLYR